MSCGQACPPSMFISNHIAFRVQLIAMRPCHTSPLGSPTLILLNEHSYVRVFLNCVGACVCVCVKCVTEPSSSVVYSCFYSVGSSASCSYAFGSVRLCCLSGVGLALVLSGSSTGAVSDSICLLCRRLGCLGRVGCQLRFVITHSPDAITVSECVHSSQVI